MSGAEFLLIPVVATALGGAYESYKVVRKGLTQIHYEPLIAKNNEIRHLVIETAEQDSDPIKCRLEHVPLSSDMGFVALSYRWGDAKSLATIKVAGKHKAIGQPRKHVKITKNLEHALRELRRRGYRRVWADQLCINQNDADERASQVMRMATVYTKAKRVVAWLDDEGMELGSGERAVTLSMTASSAKSKALETR
jgi:hypothetical protein